MKNKLTTITKCYLGMSLLITALGGYFLYQRLDVLGWDILNKEWPMYLVMYALALFLIALFWSLSNIIDHCEDETAKIFADIKNDFE